MTLQTSSLSRQILSSLHIECPFYRCAASQQVSHSFSLVSRESVEVSRESVEVSRESLQQSEDSYLLFDFAVRVSRSRASVEVSRSQKRVNRRQ